MDAVKRFDDDRLYRRAVIGLVVLFLLAAGSFAAYYYMDRYTAPKATAIDTNIARVLQMAKNDPTNPNTRTILAELYAQKGDYANAIAQYNEALKADDKSLRALAGLGQVLYKSGKTKEALASFQQVIDLTKDNDPIMHTPAMASVYYTLGQIYVSQGNLQNAEDILKFALGANPTDSDTLVAFGQVEAQMGKYQDAINLFTTALEYVPNYQEGYEGLAKAYAGAGMQTEATYASAMVDFCKGSYDSAIATLEGVVKAKPDFAEAYFGLGASHDKKGDREQAVAAYQRAIELKSDYEAAQVALTRLGGEMPANATPVAGH